MKSPGRSAWGLFTSGCRVGGTGDAPSCTIRVFACQWIARALEKRIGIGSRSRVPIARVAVAEEKLPLRAARHRIFLQSTLACQGPLGAGKDTAKRSGWKSIRSVLLQKTLWLFQDHHLHGAASPIERFPARIEADIDPVAFDGSTDISRERLPVAIDENTRP